jgi:glucose/arabinose dehydrogenase
MMRSFLLIGALAIALSACDGEPDPVQYGPDPDLPEPQRGLLPAMTIPRPALWGDDRPTVPQGYTIEPIATDLMIPRQTLVFPMATFWLRRDRAAARLRSAPRTSSRTISRVGAIVRQRAAIG